MDSEIINLVKYSLFVSLCIQIAPTLDIDRTGDQVFSNTTNVVRAVMEMVNMVHAVKSDQYVNLVRVSYTGCPNEIRSIQHWT